MRLHCIGRWWGHKKWLPPNTLFLFLIVFFFHKGSWGYFTQRNFKEMFWDDFECIKKKNPKNKNSKECVMISIARHTVLPLLHSDGKIFSEAYNKLKRKHRGRHHFQWQLENFAKYHKSRCYLNEFKQCMHTVVFWLLCYITLFQMYTPPHFVL